jgi:exosome complex component CSL4
MHQLISNGRHEIQQSPPQLQNFWNLELITHNNTTTRHLANSKLEMKDIVIPGDIIGDIADLEPGIGAYELHGKVRSSVVGIIQYYDVGDTKRRVDVLATKNEHKDVAIEVGDKVLCRVTRITMNQAVVDIISVGNHILQQQAKAIIRREDIRLSEVNDLVIHECFRPGDIVHAIVISLGDARQYYLSTANVEYGVWLAKSEKSKELLVPVSWKVIPN